MKKSELEMLANLLRNEYGLSDNGCWEITTATKEDGCWLLTVQELKDDEKTEGVENDREQ
jgi:hypothetical protein